MIEQANAAPSLDVVGMTLESVCGYGPLLVIRFAGEFQIGFIPQTDRDGNTGVRMAYGAGMMIPLNIQWLLKSVLPPQAQVILGRIVVTQSLNAQDGLLVLEFDEQYSLVVSLQCGIQVFKAGVNVVPEVTN